MNTKTKQKKFVIRTLLFALLLQLLFGFVDGSVSAETPSMSQKAILHANDADENDVFGGGLALSNDTAIVVAAFDDEAGLDAGAAYIMERNTGGIDNWGQVIKLMPPETEAPTQFGFSVAIDDDIAVVTAPEDSEGAENAGGVYIYGRNTNGAEQWGLVKKLMPADVQANLRFGVSVAIDGDTIVVGATGSENLVGMAYVFERNEGGIDNWGQVADMATPNDQQKAFFGLSVDIDRDTIVVGASTDTAMGSETGAAFIFGRNQGGSDNWGLVRRVVMDNVETETRFGTDVGIDNDTLVVGAPESDSGMVNAGVAYVFERNQGGADNWGQVEILSAELPQENDHFGNSVTIDDSTIAVGELSVLVGPTTGKVALFARNVNGADQWGLLDTLIGNDSQDFDLFGAEVALSHGNLLIGAPGEDGGNGDPIERSGAAYLFSQVGGLWQQRVRTNLSDIAPFYKFGSTVDIDGDTAIVGTPNRGDSPDDFDLGHAYILERNQGGKDQWGFVTALEPIDFDDLGLFQQQGRAVAIDGDTAVVSAQYSSEMNETFGVVFVFERNAGGADEWGMTKTLLAPEPEDDDEYGLSVAIYGDVIVVGSPYEDSENGLFTNSGATYVYERNAGGINRWGLITTMQPVFLVSDSYFGYSVSIHIDTIVIGMTGWNNNNEEDAGLVYLYTRSQVSNAFVLEDILSPNDPSEGDRFGVDVDISGDTVAVGSPYNTVDANIANAGTTYLFERNAGGADEWDQIAAIESPTPAENHNFGWSVSLDGDKLAASSLPGFEDGQVSIFERNRGGSNQWGHVQTVPPTMASEVSFGKDIALSGDAYIVGAPGDRYTRGGDVPGAVYIFDYSSRDATAVTLKDSSTDQLAASNNMVVAFVALSIITVGWMAVRQTRERQFSRLSLLLLAGVFFISAGSVSAETLPTQEIATLTADDASDGDGFRASADITNNTTVVGLNNWMELNPQLEEWAVQTRHLLKIHS